MAKHESNAVIAAFAEEQASLLTGLTVHQLRHWDRTGFFTPQFADENRRNAYSRVYSFKDLVSLQILRALRNDLGVSLQHLREVKEALTHLGDDKWSSTVLCVLNKKVVLWDSARPVEPVSGQLVFQVPLHVARANMEAAVKSLRKRNPATIGKIERHRRTAHNMPVIGGTRIPVEAVKSFARAGYDTKRILAEYPDLTKEDVEAALRYESSGEAA